MRSRASCRLYLAIVCGFALAAQPGSEAFAAQTAPVTNAPVFFDIRPGTTTRAELELRVGDPIKKPASGLDGFEYAAPRGASDVNRLVVGFFDDTKLVSRLDVYFKAPIPADPLREQFGTRVLQLDRRDGGQDEVFYPRLNGIVTARKQPGSPAVAVTYFSPRYVADLYVERSDQARKARRLDDAVDEADKAVLIDPDYARGYVAQGLLFWDRKNYDEAVVRFVAATNAKYSVVTKARAHTFLAGLYTPKSADRASKEFQAATALAPEDGFSHLEYGRFLRGQKLDDAALQEFKKAVALNARDTDAALQLAELLFAKRDYQGALPHYQRLTQWFDSPAGANSDAGTKVLMHHRLAFCLLDTKQLDPAIAEYERLLETAPADAHLLHSVAFAYESAGRFPEALDRYERALKLTPQDLKLNWNYVHTLLAANRFEDVRRQAQVCLRLKPSDSNMLLFVARSWAAEKKKHQALEWLKKAVDAGYRNRAELSVDPYFAHMRDNGDFKKLLAQMT